MMTEMVMIVTLGAVEVRCICYLRIRVSLRVNVAAHLLHQPGEQPELQQQRQRQQQQQQQQQRQQQQQQQQQQKQQSPLSSAPSATSEPPLPYK